MSESMFSPLWYRVAELKPQLRQHVKIQRQIYRGQVQYIIQDQASGRHHRFNSQAYEIIGRMGSELTLAEIWQICGTQMGGDAPTQGEIIQILAQLHAADLLQTASVPDAAELFERFQRHQKSAWKQRLFSPLMQRIPLLDPNRMLDRMTPWTNNLFTKLSAGLWIVIIAIGALLAVRHWPELTHGTLEQTLSPYNLLLLSLTYPVVKTLHEFGHALAVKHWGGEVHEMGVLFMVLMPIPYVDASSAWSFNAKSRRMIVGAAGIMVELFLASLALVLWLNIEPGIIRSIMFNIMLIGGVSTLFFNGNPLLRFDGYYVLQDAIEIPNLAARSNQYIGYLIQHYGFGAHDVISPASAPGENKWFLFYGIASFAYRMIVLATIIFFIAGKFFVAGIVLALWVATTQIVLPLLKSISFVLNNPALQPKRFRAVSSSVVLALVLAALIMLLPVPQWTQAQGVIWSPEEALIRAGVDGFVESVRVSNGTEVQAGDILIETRDPLLDARLKVLQARTKELGARYTSVAMSDPVEAGYLKEEIAAVEAGLTKTKQQFDKLVIRSKTTGVFTIEDADRLQGRYLHKGDLIAYVVDSSRVTARVIISQHDIDLVRRHTHSAHVKLAGDLSRTLPVTITRKVPAATHQLPSKALAASGGGRIATDPQDADGLYAIESLFQLEILFPPHVFSPRIGERVYVRFDHDKAPLAQQWYRKSRQLFLRKLGV